MRCDGCGRHGESVAQCMAERMYLCWECYHRTPGSVCTAPPGTPTPPPREPRRKPSPYEAFWQRVYDRLCALCPYTVFIVGDGTGRFLCHCPVCQVGTLVVQTVDADPRPQLEVKGCDNGCTDVQIAKVILG